MNALSQDRNWLKIIGIVAVLSITLLFSQCSREFIYRSQVNAPRLVQSACMEQVHNYDWKGYFLENIEEQGSFPNPYPEFYTHSSHYSKEQVSYYATSRSPYLKSYVGLVVSLPKPRQNNSFNVGSAIGIVCEAIKPGETAATDPSFNGSTLTCGAQTRQVGDVISTR